MKQSLGVELLKRPLVPLTFLLCRLFMATRLPTIQAAVNKLKENITLDGITYDSPQGILQDYLDIFEPLERFKKGECKSARRLVVDGNKNVLDPVAGMILEIKQELITRELEQVNSALCGQYQCIICCRGPLKEEENFFFELPLTNEEAPLFNLPLIDDSGSRKTHAFADPPYKIGDQPFYMRDSALYRWRDKWGLVLVKDSFCPNLINEDGRCRIYEKRPRVCRLPQIFPLALETIYDPQVTEEIAAQNSVSFPELTDKVHYYVVQEKILAVWDCPYVRDYKQEIIKFAEVSSLEPVFRQNKK